MSPFDINSVVFHFDDFNYGRRYVTTIFFFNNCNSVVFFHKLLYYIKYMFYRCASKASFFTH